MIPTFNCAKYLCKTLNSVLAQDLGPGQMQIEVIDDLSTQDDPEPLVMELGKGRVSFYRKPQNGGAIANFNTCIERSRGHLVHILHGDDWVENGFYEQFQKAFEQHSDIGICIARVFVVEENGELDSLSPRIPLLESLTGQAEFMYYNNPVRTPGVVVRRRQYELQGGFLLPLVHTADWEMWIRIIRRSRGAFLNKPLASYRFFPGNDTGRLIKSAENLHDYLRLANIIKNYDDKFDFKKFQNNVMRMAMTQSRLFEEIGNVKAYEANKTFYKELLAKQPIKRRVIEAARNALLKLVRITN